MTYKILVVTQTHVPAPPYSIKSLPNANRLDIIARVLLSSIQGKLSQPDKLLVYFSKDHALASFNINHTGNPSYDDLTELKTGEFLLALFRSYLTASIPLRSSLSSSLVVTLMKNVSFQTLLNNEVMKGMHPVLLDPNGTSWKIYFSNRSPQNELFVIGARDDLSHDQQVILHDLKATSLSLGSKQYLASQVITFLRYFMTGLNKSVL